ncbi:hypothetical protein VTL71DRAFT_12980 [Oculimacula yallundae]|uniref:Apple domain-containing protein n=1 Tax=Oculimacula yallundae TaxID=86028 RepID=A0ABR4CPA4_9HELO
MTRLWAISSLYGILLTAAEAASYSACRARSPCELNTCLALPAASATSCSSFLSQNYIEVPTCTSQSTVYKTVILPQAATSASVSNIFVTATVTETLATTTVSTSFATSLSTMYDYLVSVSYHFYIGQSLINPKLPRTSTVVSTTRIIPGQFCTQIEARGLERDKLEIPKDCSCFLTKTLALDPTTVTTTSYIPAATTGGTNDQPVTQTLIVTRVETSTITSVVSSTIISVTTTSVTTTVSALPSDLCNNPFTFSGSNAFRYAGAVASPPIITDISTCCTTCFTTRSCANYVFNPSSRECTIFLTTVAGSDRCISDACPLGRADGTFILDPDASIGYGPGPCGGSIRR